MKHDTRAYRHSGAALCVAIVDADDAAVEQLEPALQAAGFETERIQLADFPDSESVVAALVARGVDVVLYELSGRLPQNQRRFQDLYAASRGRGRPLFITSVLRWLEEEHKVDGDEATGSPALDRLIQAVQREANLYRELE